MNAVVKSSVVLLAIIVVLNLVVVFSGIQIKSPGLAGGIFVIVALLITIGCVFWGLSMTAGANGYGKQLLNAALIGLLAGVLITAFSMLLLGVLMPDYLDEVKLAAIEQVEASPAADEVKQRQIDQIEKTTVVSNGVAGLIGTFLTSLISGAIIAIFKRKK